MKPGFFRMHLLQRLVWLFLAAALIQGCSKAPEDAGAKSAAAGPAPATAEEFRAIAEEAYTFAFPMLMGYRYGFATFLVPSLPSYKGPVNGIYGKAVTLDHNFKDVITPNADTPYSMAMLDLRAEPLVLQVPEVADRYYVMQFVDLFGYNPHYVGTRATGTKAGKYLLVGPRWQGQAADGFDGVLPFETDFVFVIGRNQLLGADDAPALGKLMQQYTLQTLSAYRGEAGPAEVPVDWPVWNDDASRDERFIGYVNFLLQFCQPTHPSEAELMQRFARIGIAPGAAFDLAALDPAIRDEIRAGISDARSKMATGMGAEKVNGWVMSDAMGSREFFNGNYLLRAAGAMGGWGGNDKIEAFYPITREDSNGESLDGAYRYHLKLMTPPPARAFWSVTMYDTSYDGVAGYLVENPINRYLINSTTEGLVRGKDGSLDIVIQRDKPESAADQANWLPAPEGKFYLALRLYYPEQAALDGTWTPPPVVKVE
jgi:hypothetical protein